MHEGIPSVKANGEVGQSEFSGFWRFSRAGFWRFVQAENTDVIGSVTRLAKDVGKKKHAGHPQEIRAYHGNNNQKPLRSTAVDQAGHVYSLNQDVGQHQLCRQCACCNRSS